MYYLQFKVECAGRLSVVVEFLYGAYISMRSDNSP